MLLDRDTGYGLPPADTGVWLLDWVSELSTGFLRLERRSDPFFHPAFDAPFRQLPADVTTVFRNLGRKNERVQLAEETIQPDEETFLDALHFGCRPRASHPRPWSDECGFAGEEIYAGRVC